MFSRFSRRSHRSLLSSGDNLSHADVVVRLTADNPLIDAGFLDWAVSEHLAGMPSYDYVDTVHSKTFPLGMSVEVMGFAALETAWNEDTNKAWREHCTPFIYYHPERFRLRHLSAPDNYSHMRWTVDTPEDLAFVRQIYGHFGHVHFNWRDVIVCWRFIRSGATSIGISSRRP